MNSNAQELYTHSSQIGGKVIPILIGRDAESDGIKVTEVQQEADVNSAPELGPTFGVLSERFENPEGNDRRGKFVKKTWDTADPWLKITKRLALENGAGVATETETKYIDITSGVPAPTSNGLLVVSSEITAFDRAHGIQKDVVVDQWNPLVTTKNNDSDAFGGTTTESRQIKLTSDALPSNTALTLANYKEAIDSVKSWHVLKTAASFGTLVNKDGLTEESLGVGSTVTIDIEDDTFVMPDPGFRTLVSKLVQSKANPKQFVYTRAELDADWPNFIDYEEEPETGLLVTVSRNIVDNDTAPTLTAGAARHTRKLKRLDNQKWLYVDREIHEDVLTTTFQERHNVKYYFPSYLSATTPFLIINAGESTAVSPNKSSDHVFSIPCRFEITYHSSVPAVSEVFQFKTIDMHLTTPQFSIHENDIVCDGGTATFFINTETAGNFIFSYTFPSSSPTTTEYLAAMGTEKLIADTVQRWKFNLWRRTKVWLKLPEIQSSLSGSLGY